MIGGFFYYRAYRDLEQRTNLSLSTSSSRMDALEEMNRRLWTEIKLLQSEIDQLEADLRRAGFDMLRAASHDQGEN